MDITGLAVLLKTLVKAANEDVFPEIPSVWTGFLKLTALEALADSTQHYEQLMQKFTLVVPHSYWC